MQRSRYKQTLVLFSSYILLMVLGFGIKGIQTRALGVEAYGVFAFFITITTFFAIFFKFGFFTSVKVLLAEEEEEQKESELTGAGLVSALVIGFFFSLFMGLISYPVEAFFSERTGQMVLALSPLCFVFPLQQFANEVTIGSNKIRFSALLNILPKSFFLIALAYFYFFLSLSIMEVALMNLLTILLGVLIIVGLLKPSFRNLKPNWKRIREKWKSYGSHVYWGELINQPTHRLDELLIVYFVGTAQLGFYTLAYMLCAPLVMFSQSIVSAYFKDFASLARIPKRIQLINMGSLVLFTVVLLLFAPFFVDLLFGASFEKVAEYAVLLVFACFFQGAYQPFNFLSSKSQGKQIKRVSVIEGVVNVVGYAICIPIWGVYGAIGISILAKMMHFLGKLYYYRLYIKKAG